VGVGAADGVGIVGEVDGVVIVGVFFGLQLHRLMRNNMRIVASNLNFILPP
jgi:hypothetical protein